MPEVIAILCSDIHLSENPPIARAEEPDWFETMKGYLDELRSLSDDYEVPILCGGDVFDKSGYGKKKVSAELVNFAINNVPKMYVVAGQHDLPHHRFDDIRKSVLWTMVEADVVHLLDEEPLYIHDVDKSFNVTGYSWGREIKPPQKTKAKTAPIEILVTHKYVWAGKSSCYPGAGLGSYLGAQGELFSGYDVVLLGDNHKHWKGTLGKSVVYNPGSFMRRNSDQLNHRPVVGLFKEDGSIENHYLDISKDVLVQTVEKAEKETDNLQITEFIEGLKGLGEKAMDFASAIDRFMDEEKVSDGVRGIIMEAMETK